jgi:hypothetical protein
MAVSTTDEPGLAMRRGSDGGDGTAIAEHALQSTQADAVIDAQVRECGTARTDGEFVRSERTFDVANYEARIVNLNTDMQTIYGYVLSARFETTTTEK